MPNVFSHRFSSESIKITLQSCPQSLCCYLCVIRDHSQLSAFCEVHKQYSLSHSPHQSVQRKFAHFEIFFLWHCRHVKCTCSHTVHSGVEQRVIRIAALCQKVCDFWVFLHKNWQQCRPPVTRLRSNIRMKTWHNLFLMHPLCIICIYHNYCSIIAFSISQRTNKISKSRQTSFISYRFSQTWGWCISLSYSILALLSTHVALTLSFIYLFACPPPHPPFPFGFLCHLPLVFWVFG